MSAGRTRIVESVRRQYPDHDIFDFGRSFILCRAPAQGSPMIVLGELQLANVIDATDAAFDMAVRWRIEAAEGRDVDMGPPRTQIERDWKRTGGAFRELIQHELSGSLADD